ncbi:cupin domain-containing protein [Roseomonas xinghualingensis]|uniref:cupin domain-containing protein n=1 Tax=Roseomonas xinghualingensis TaxID=2986475 RepID=UPI0021F2071A|nr:cupin domain-containing protein [Roseomonas sp. SXEYE001]MCV4206959.1 cupin domain-containing protein [Roseomonas sp. SXEYE001]
MPAIPIPVAEVRRFFLRAEDVTPYSPANHTGTSNRRVIAPETVGATQMEVLIGTIERGNGALPHAHPTLEQTCYIMEGRALVEVGGESREVGPGDFCFFPIGVEHVVTVTSEQPLKLMVIYAPPYGEDPAKVTRRAGGHG